MKRRPPRTGGPPQRVRIVGGRWRRSLLPVADVPGLRPTPDRVRETLFNWLGQDLGGWACLDAYAGTGALGFEAASRGAADVVLLEREPPLVAALKASKQRLQADTVRIEHADALAWMRNSPDRFDLVFLDPPFEAGALGDAIRAARECLRPGGSLYVEAPEPVDAADFGMVERRRLRAGAVSAQWLALH